MRQSFAAPGSVLALSALLFAPDALAQTPATADQPEAAPLPPVRVIERPAGSLTIPGVEAQRQAVEQTAAAAHFIPAEDYQNRYAFNLRDVLAETPGVYVQNRYGQELRLSIRGSAIARGFHLRGVELLQDGIPFNSADGSGDFYQIDPLGTRSVEVYPGGNALTYGASTLGGAVNFTSPTAYTAEAPNLLRAEGGSFGTWRASGQISRVLGNLDFLGNATFLGSDGYRQHSRSQYEQFNANVGYRIAPNIETRFFLGYYLTRQLLPGTLSLQDALHNPTRSLPNVSGMVIGGNQARNVWAQRVANRTTVTTGIGRLDFDTWFIHKQLYHPIFQVIDQDGFTWGIAPRLTTEFNIAGLRDELVVGGRYFAGTNDALQYINIAGSRGRQTLKARQDAQNYELYAENRLWVLPQLAVVAGAKLLRDERDYRDFGGGLTSSRGAANLGRTYDGFNPRIGLLWQPKPDMQFFANLTRSQDVPDFSDLAQTRADRSTDFVPLQSQRAWTVEVGTRGHHGRFGWDLTLFNSVIHDQLLQFTTVANQIPASTFNAGTTVNRGVEFAGRVDLLRNITAPDAGDRLTLGQVWTFNDFHFRNDRQFGNNRIAGLPPHVLRTTLSYTRPDGLFIRPKLDWVPTGAFADYANTLQANGYVVFGIEAGFSPRPGLTLFLDARNLNGERYVSDLSTIVNARAAGANTAIFYPGDGRSIYVGARLAL